MISYGKQSIDQSDIDCVIEVLKSDWLTQGPAVELFESHLKEYFGSNHACVVSNGTAALHLVGLALGWQKDDIIITTPITFSSSYILYWMKTLSNNISIFYSIMKIPIIRSSQCMTIIIN